MSKDKSKHDEAKEALGESKEAKKAAKTELKSFDKKNKVKKGKTDDLKKDQKKERKALVEAVETADADIVTAKAAVKDSKPKKDRESKYSYPEDVKGDAKAEKRFRASIRGKAKSAGMTVEEYLEDPEAGDAAIEKAKKAKKEDKPKKEKKDKKKDDKKKDKKKDKKEEAPDDADDDDDDDDDGDDD